MALLKGGVKDYNTITAIAVDKDKNSQAALRWAAENILNKCPRCVLIHVRTQAFQRQEAQAVPKEGHPPTEPEMQRFFLPYRGYCARKGIAAEEVVLHDIDVPSALLHYVTTMSIQNLVVGAPSRGAFIRKFRSADVPTNLLKLAPESCNIYVIAKGKAQTVWSPRPEYSPSATPRQYSRREQPHATPDTQNSVHMSSRGRGVSNGNDRGQPDKSRGVWMGYNRFRRSSRTPSPPLSLASSSSGSSSNGSLHFSRGSYTSGTSSNQTSMSEFSDFSGPFSFRSFGTPSDTSESSMSSSSSNPSSNLSGLEAQLMRLKIELKQSIDMYNLACREATLAKKKVQELQLIKTDVKTFQDAKLAEEAALLLVEKEGQNMKAAMEAADMAQQLAQIEIEKRKHAKVLLKEAEIQEKRETNETSYNGFQCRIYTIDEIEAATDHFSSSFKVGEGGYGPVFKGFLDHTPVAIKVLRPDISQGQQQFQREVEVLSCIRHPHMVLLLGTCPDYGCLVYEYMEYGSLEDRLFRKGNTPPIPWRIRFKIAVEIATGLLSLHQTKPDPVVHRDLKPANILLDRNYVSKISDVGLARLIPASLQENITQYHMTDAAGTLCFIDPEYQQTGMLSVKSDLFSLGILLLQLVTARPAMGLKHHIQIAIEKGTFSEMLDPTMKDCPVEAALSLTKLAIKCSELKKKDRPDLATVVLPELTRLLDITSNYDAN